MRTLIALAVDKFGRIDCLFNNAGGPAQTGGIEGLEVERFDAAMATLVRSVMLGMKHAAPHMKKQGSGSIINNGSIAGRLAGFSSSVVYGAAKAAVIHLTKCVAMELGESGIRVNSISPGAIATGIFGKALGLPVDAAEKTPAVMREVYKTAQPIPRAGTISWSTAPSPAVAIGASSSRAMSPCARRLIRVRGSSDDHDVRFVVGAGGSPADVDGRHRRPCLRAGARQGAAADDGCHLGGS